jgi:hypothetical protein
MIAALLMFVGWVGLLFSVAILVMKTGVALGQHYFDIMPRQVAAVLPLWLQFAEVMLVLSLLILGIGRMIRLIERR